MKFKISWISSEGVIALLWVVMVGIVGYSGIYYLNKIDKEHTDRLYIKIQSACNQEGHFGQARVIGNGYYCEVGSGGILYPIRLECGKDDPICAKDTETCRRMGYLDAKSIGNGTIACRDNGDTLVFLQHID